MPARSAQSRDTTRGLPIAIPFGIPTYWSPEAALAIFEFVDEMRDIILAVYATQLQDAARERWQSPPTSRRSSRTTNCHSDRRYQLKNGAIGPVLCFGSTNPVPTTAPTSSISGRPNISKKLRIYTGANRSR